MERLKDSKYGGGTLYTYMKIKYPSQNFHSTSVVKINYMISNTFVFYCCKIYIIQNVILKCIFQKQ
jgi:hypothetical protein